MSILFVDSDLNNLNQLKEIVGKEGNHFVVGLNDSLMLLETVTEFELIVANYNLNDATGKDLHENFRMLPETENNLILFYTYDDNKKIIDNLNKMSNIQYLVKPSIAEISFKIAQIIESKNSLNEEITSDNNNSNENINFESFFKTNEENTPSEISEKNFEIVDDIKKLSLNKKYSGNLKKNSLTKIFETATTFNNYTKLYLKNTISDESCEIYITDGIIVDVVMELFSPEDALFWVLTWEEADFELSIIETHKKHSIDINVEDIIKDVILKQQEFQELSQTLPDLKTILIKSPHYNESSSNFEKDYKNILELFNGENTINDVLSYYKNDNLYALAIISQLFINEIIVEKNEITSQPFETPIEIKKEEKSNDVDLFAQYGIDDLFENSKKEVSEKKEISQEIKEDTNSSQNLKISTDILQEEEIDLTIDKELFIKNVVESFKYEKQIEFTKKPQMYSLIMFFLSIATIISGFYIITKKPEPKKVIINQITTEEKIIQNNEYLYLGIDNKINYIKEQFNVIQDVLGANIIKNYQSIEYKMKLEKSGMGKFVKEADFYLKNKNYKKAIDIYLQVLKTMPNNKEILFHLAVSYYFDENNEEALKYVEKLDFIDFKSNEFLLFKAQLYQSTNDPLNAIKYYKEYLKNVPDSSLKKEINIIVVNIAKNNGLQLVD